MTATSEEIANWIHECSTEVEEEGGLSLVSLVHYQASGAEVELHTMTPKNTKVFGDSHGMGAVLDAISTRHARGIMGGGVQQFELLSFFGTATKPKRRLPFTRVGMTNHGFAPGGGLATEPPSVIGMAAQSQRWGEIVLQGAVAKDQAMFTVMGTIIRDLAASNKELFQQTGELFLGYRKLLAETAQTQQETALKVVIAKRNAAMLQEALRLSPAILNAVTGSEIVPMGAADTAILRGLTRMISPEQLHSIAGLAAQNGPEAAAAFAALVNRLEQIQHQDHDDAAKLKELSSQGLGFDGELDAQGLVDPRAELLKVIEPKQLDKGDVKGAQTGNGGGAKGVQANEDQRLLDDLFASVPSGKMSLLIGALAGENPQLAARIRQRSEKSKAAME